MDNTLQLGFIESAKTAFPTDKSSRTTLHYIIQNDRALDPVLPATLLGYIRMQYLSSSFQSSHLNSQLHIPVLQCNCSML